MVDIMTTSTNIYNSGDYLKQLYNNFRSKELEQNAIIGNGISTYIIAACLEYRNESFVIFSNNQEIKLPSIMHLQYDNNEELELYKKIFHIDNIKDFIIHVKVGYRYHSDIYKNPTWRMLCDYLSKQNRKKESSSMNSLNSDYHCLDLVKICKLLIERYKNKVILFDKEINVNDYTQVYDTMGLLYNIEKHEFKYYLVYESNDIKNYSYVYDCNNNTIKRYTKTTTEYIKKPKDKNSIELTNYYDEFCVYRINNICLIGRYATGTQTKQKDIIDYLIKNKGNVKYL